jgi:structural maintenance of chromosome 1
VNNILFCRLEYEQKRDMHAPIAKLKDTIDSLEKELKGLQERESGAKAVTEQISNQMEELKAEAEGTHSKLVDCFPVVLVTYGSQVGMQVG